MLRALLPCLCLLMLAHPIAARPAAVDSLPALRRALARYDLRGGTLALLSDMQRMLSDARPHEHGELRFLRAAVAADLAFIAAVRDDDALSTSVATALGLAPDALPGWLDSELASAQGAYRAPARALRRALAHLSTPEAKVDELAGTQGEVLRLLAVREALARTDDAVAALSAFAADPCTDGECLPRFARLDLAGRRAAAALERAVAALAHLRRAAEVGDPLAAALAPELARLEGELRAIELRPVPNLPAHAELPEADDIAPLAADLVLIVNNDAVHYGHAPRLRIGSDGEIEAFARGEPMLPSLERIPLPGQLRPYPTPLEQVVALVRAARQHEPALRVGAGAARGTRAHLLSRVLLSLHAAGHTRGYILARAGDGHARALEVDLVRKRAASDAPDAPVRLRIRLGGYSLHRGGDYEDIPRVRGEDGLRFDVEALLAHLDTRVERAEISFMADVASETLMTTTLQLAQRTERLGLVFP